ncbi:MAG: laccase domain-containing protein, partial [Myxococcota bacterium]
FAKPHVDLTRVLRAQLRSLGIREEFVEDVGGATYADPERFFSYRRDGKATGRHLAAIVAR